MDIYELKNASIIEGAGHIEKGGGAPEKVGLSHS